MAESPWQPLAVMPGMNSKEWYVNSEDKPGKRYTVFTNFDPPKCNCPDYPKHKGEPDYRCKHVTAVMANFRSTEPEKEESGGMAVPPPSNTYSKWTKKIHGRDFITYEGLLAMAHEKGLTELAAEFVSVTADLALAAAHAFFADGRKFWESGDATPNNVAPQVKAHFPRIALTRAKARTLRDALNIGMVSAEEMMEE